jgi:DNA-binding CsgD family transcriptional regulator
MSYAGRMLLGREAEQQTISELLRSARSGRSAVLVLRGDPGIGKTALLSYAQSCAEGMTVLRSVGIEAEHELPFAGLHQLVRPCLGLLERLPPPQQRALRGAFGLSFEPVENPFLVALGLLSLLAEASDELPVLCLIDDAHWLDRPSQTALVFAARRLDAEPIAVLASARSREPQRFESSGLPELELPGLDDASAGALLRSRMARPATDEVARRLLETADGNPLALLELPAGLTTRQLDGAEPILGPPPARGAVEESFRVRVAALSQPVRTGLLLAAVEQSGDLRTLEEALQRSGVTPAVLVTAQHAGLVQVDETLAFRHPLVRSAVYASASDSERRAAHQTLAAVLEDPVSSAWHLALVSDQADEAIAIQLDAAAAQAVARGAHATAAAAFERASELSEDAALKGRRLVYAAQTSVAAGRSDAALTLADRARQLIDDPVDVAELDVVRAMISSRQGTPAQTFSLARSAAAVLAERQPERALQMVSLMVWASSRGGWSAAGIPDAHAVLQEIKGGGAGQAFMEMMLTAAMALLAGDAVGARDGFDQALAIADTVETDPDVTRLAGLLCMWIADFMPARDRFARVVAQYRFAGSLTELEATMPLLAISEMCVSRPDASAEVTAEGLELTRQLSFEQAEITYAALQAWTTSLTGDEETCRDQSAAAIQRGLATGLGWAVGEAHLALGLLELGLGNARAAIDHFEQTDPGPFPPTMVLATPEFIDAALRLGESERAQLALKRLETWAPVSRTALVAGMVARCRGIMASVAEEAELCFQEALRHHDYRVQPYERARTQLAYGERLRRDRRRIQARIQLRAALDTFEGIGAMLWAQRSRDELRATGETARRREASTLDDLTPQELRVARLVASGASNKDVAAQLFLSRRTVEYHLGKVFIKLGVSSRAQLAHVGLAPDDEPALATDHA